MGRRQFFYLRIEYGLSRIVPYRLQHISSKGLEGIDEFLLITIAVRIIYHQSCCGLISPMSGELGHGNCLQGIRGSRPEEKVAVIVGCKFNACIGGGDLENPIPGG